MSPLSGSAFHGARLSRDECLFEDPVAEYGYAGGGVYTERSWNGMDSKACVGNAGSNGERPA